MPKLGHLIIHNLTFHVPFLIPHCPSFLLAGRHALVSLSVWAANGVAQSCISTPYIRARLLCSMPVQLSLLRTSQTRMYVRTHIHLRVHNGDLSIFAHLCSDCRNSPPPSLPHYSSPLPSPLSCHLPKLPSSMSARLRRSTCIFNYCFADVTPSICVVFPLYSIQQVHSQTRKRGK